MERLNTILKRYISDKIPQKATNIFWQMFNGIDAMFTSLETRLDIVKRERNILTANQNVSLRHLASQNGFEPSLKIPATGILKMTINPKLFSRKGYPLFLPPYSIFTDSETKLKYYFNSDRALKIDTNILYIPVVDGEVASTAFTSSGKFIERIYLPEENISNGSIVVNVGSVQYTQVKSFLDNNGLFDDKQFEVKFSSDIQNPIVIYIKGTNYNDSISVSYRLTTGELGNIEGKHSFDTEDVIDGYGTPIEFDTLEVEIINFSGFEYGSNGSDENMLRAAIGYNHGKDLLFDSISYSEFLNRFSTLLLQDIKINDDSKSINHIYISKKQTINTSVTNLSDLIYQYQNIINNTSYIISASEKLSLTKIISESEYALSSHVLYNPIVCKFAVQLEFESKDDIIAHEDNIKRLIYGNFSIFLHKRHYVFNFEIMIQDYIEANNIKLSYIIFNEFDELNKINNSAEISTGYIIQNSNYIPILKGDFGIIDSDGAIYNLFFDINTTIK